MAIATPWRTFDPDTPRDVVGVYELGHVTFGTVRTVYIGSGSVASRLAAHRRDPEKTFTHYRCEYTYDRRRARQRERKLQRTYRERRGALPVYNARVG